MGNSPDGQGETPDNDAGQGQGAGENGSGWQGTGEEFDSLRSSFRSSYQDAAAEGPSRDEVTRALRTLGGALTHMVAGAGNTLKDPAVKQQVQRTTKTAVAAIATMFSEWAAELRSRLEERGEGRQDSGAEPHSTNVRADTAEKDAGPRGQDPQGP